MKLYLGYKMQVTLEDLIIETFFFNVGISLREIREFRD